MSRVGKQPITLPKDVSADIKSGNVAIKGPKGTLNLALGSGVSVATEAGNLVVSMTGSDAQSKANWGTTRARLNNMVKGVTAGWKRSLEMNGVGFTAKINGQNLVLAVGFSHDVTVVLPKEIKCTVNKNVIDLESADRELVGTYAAKIRKVKKPEPYLGKGIKYAEEKIRRKAGKTGKK
jgi:large subunit ribosomal protein L6